MSIGNVSTSSTLSIVDLERFPLSVMLSFLTEEEGTSLLLTHKKWCKKVLPIFRLPVQETIFLVNEPRNRVLKNRHKFIVVPVQDASTLLARLNTLRWKRQRIPCRGLSTDEYVTARGGDSAIGHHPGHPPLLKFTSTTGNTGKSTVFRPGTTILASYPRSGNTLLRSLLEATTGIVTGSDTRPDRPLSIALAEKHDLVGEGLIHPSQTPLVKTHWPERIGWRKFSAQRVILLVRNPFDAIDSYWNLNVTNTHTAKVTEEVYEKHSDFFQKLALNEMNVWLDFLSYWDSQKQQIPICWVRYEDLMHNPQCEVLRILQFATVHSREEWSGRVEQALQQKGHGYQAAAAPAPASNTLDQETERANGNSRKPSFGRSLKRYSSKLLEQMHAMDASSGWLEKLGYHVFRQGFPGNHRDLPLEPSSTRNSLDSEWQQQQQQQQQQQYYAQYSDNGAATNSPPPPTTSPSTAMAINHPPALELRPRRCPYGRNMRDWRRTHTKNDTEPFPTVSTSR